MTDAFNNESAVYWHARYEACSELANSAREELSQVVKALSGPPQELSPDHYSVACAVASLRVMLHKAEAALEQWRNSERRTIWDDDGDDYDRLVWKSEWAKVPKGEK